MFYTVYKTTNLINNKSYIGAHQTTDLDDGYMGSGKLLKLAIAKYGLENFTKEILGIFDTPKEMFELEKSLVNESTLGPNLYNLKIGGEGGFDHINSNLDVKCSLSSAIGKKTFHYGLAARKKYMDEVDCDPEKAKEFSDKVKAGLKRKQESGWINPHWGEPNSPEAYKRAGAKISNMYKGSGNPQFGTCWITKDNINKKIPKIELETYIAQGFRPGRVM